MLCKTYTSLLTFAILSTTVHIVMCHMLSKLLLLTPSSLPVMQCSTEYLCHYISKPV